MSTSEANKTTLQQANAAIARGDHEGFLSHCTDDTEWNFIGDQILKGKQAVRQWMTKTYLEPPKFMVTNMIAEGDFVAAYGEITVKDAQGAETHSSYCDVWRFRDGKMVELRAYVVT
ncbi:MAG: nuclear transport factor 2 family protein [Pseudomonadota bacterium]